MNNKDDNIKKLKEKIENIENNKKFIKKVQKQKNGAGFGFKISTEIVAAIVVGVGIGLLVDNYFNTKPFGLIIFFYRHALSADEAFFVQDVMVQNYPFREYFSQTIKSGGFSLWNSAISMGFPLFAEGQAGPIYPLNVVLGLLFPTHVGIVLSTIIHAWLGAVGMYFLMRLWNVTPISAATSGLIFALSGYTVVRVMSPNFVAASAWLPFLCAVITIWLNDGRRWSIAAVAICSGVLGKSGCFAAVSPDPVTAQDIKILLIYF